MIHVTDFYPVKRTITREYDEEGHLLKETIQEFDTEKKNIRDEDGLTWQTHSNEKPQTIVI